MYAAARDESEKARHGATPNDRRARMTREVENGQAVTVMMHSGQGKFDCEFILDVRAGKIAQAEAMNGAMSVVARARVWSKRPQDI